MNRSLLLCGLCLLTCLLMLAEVVAAESARRPNVLLICVDDLKPLLGCYGVPTIHSPNIDRLAARGVLFERAFCNQAVCAPSRNALMTGLRPQSIGIYDLGTNFREAVPDAVTLAQHFRRHGYRTEALGKIFHVGHGNHEDPASWSVPHFRAKTIGYVLPENRATLTREEALFENALKQPLATLPKGAATECADVPDNAYGDGLIADEAIRRLLAAQKKLDEPWFLAVGFLKPHLPFCAPKKYWDLYDPASLPLPTLTTPPVGAPPFAPTKWGELRNYSDIPPIGPLDEPQTRHLIHGYYAAVSYMDAQLGRVLDALDGCGFSDNTIIVLWGDHGWHLGDHGMWCKHTNYEQAARIPLIICTPGMASQGAKTGALAETVDLYPTLCELASLPVPSALDGASLAAVVRNPTATIKEAVFHAYPRDPRMGRAVRTARYRLVEWKRIGEPADQAVYELYDYQSDPDETKNLAAERPEVVAQLQALLARLPEAQPQVRAGRQETRKPAAKSTTVKPPERLILDTDMSGDCDDAGTLALVHALADRGECRLLAVVTNRKDKTNASAAAVDVINTYYGRPELPIGTSKQTPTALQRTSAFAAALRDEFPNDIGPDDRAPDALDIYRKTLAAQPDGSVTICSVGALSNLAELVEREPELVRAKVRQLVVMGGLYTEGNQKKWPEVNILTHREASQIVAARWPGEIVWHGYEVGVQLITGARLKQVPQNNPVRRAYELKPYQKRMAIEGGQPSWDQGAALFAVRGAEPPFWEVVRGGRVEVDDQGVTAWITDPNGRHAYVKIKGEPRRLADVIESLMIQTPRGG